MRIGYLGLYTTWDVYIWTRRVHLNNASLQLGSWSYLCFNFFSSNLAPHCFLCSLECLSLSDVWIYTCPKFFRPGRGFRISSGKWEELGYQQSRSWIGNVLTLNTLGNTFADWRKLMSSFWEQCSDLVLWDPYTRSMTWCEKEQVIQYHRLMLLFLLSIIHEDYYQRWACLALLHTHTQRTLTQSFRNENHCGVAVHLGGNTEKHKWGSRAVETEKQVKSVNGLLLRWVYRPPRKLWRAHLRIFLFFHLRLFPPESGEAGAFAHWLLSSGGWGLPPVMPVLLHWLPYMSWSFPEQNHCHGGEAASWQETTCPTCKWSHGRAGDAGQGINSVSSTHTCTTCMGSHIWGNGKIKWSLL